MHPYDYRQFGSSIYNGGVLVGSKVFFFLKAVGSKVKVVFFRDFLKYHCAL